MMQALWFLCVHCNTLLLSLSQGMCSYAGNKEYWPWNKPSQKVSSYCTLVYHCEVFSRKIKFVVKMTHNHIKTNSTMKINHYNVSSAADELSFNPSFFSCTVWETWKRIWYWDIQNGLDETDAYTCTTAAESRIYCELLLQLWIILRACWCHIHTEEIQ